MSALLEIRGTHSAQEQDSKDSRPEENYASSTVSIF